MVRGSPVLVMRRSIFVVLLMTCLCRADLLPGTEDEKGIYYEMYPVRESLALASIDNATKSYNVTELGENIFRLNCTAPTIQDFPPDMFTQEIRRQGNFLLQAF